MDSMEQMLEVFRQFRISQDKFNYFLLAVAGSGVALSVQWTRDSAMSLQLIPLGFAVGCWVLSIVCGCRFQEYNISTLYTNHELLKIEEGIHPQFGCNPQAIAAAKAGILQAIEYNTERSQQWSNWQTRFLVFGAVCFLIWRIVDMALN